MSVQWSAPELATRYSTHVEELRDFFALQHLHFGSAQDIAPLVARIDSSESFREDLSSMVRSVILHEGGTIPRANLLEIVAFAVGGRDMDEASLEVQEPLRQLLSFLIGVQRKPWNQPPGESRLHFAPPSTASRSLDETPQPHQSASQEIPPATAKVIPITTREAAPAVIPVQPDPQAAAQPAVRPFTRPDEVFSRLTHRETESPAPTSAAAPESAAEPETVFSAAAAPEPEPAPEPEAAADREPEPVTLASAPPAPPEPELEPEPIPALACKPVPRPAAVPAVMPPSALDPEPPSPSFHVAMHLPIELPSFAIPDLPLPQITLPASPRARARIAVFAAGGAVLLIAVFVFASRPHLSAASPAPPQSSPPAPPPASATAVPPGVSAPPAAPAYPAKPSAYGAATAQPAGHISRQSARDDGYIAQPYSTPSPIPSPAPIVRISPAQSATAAAPLNPSGAAYPVAVPTSAQPAPRARPIDPDATFVGAGSTADTGPPLPRRPASVAAAVMSANLLSAPEPGYPMLAKVAHIQGKVVLRAQVDRDGTVSDISVLSGHHLLRGAAVDAVRRWRYRPYLIDGQPATVFTTITLRFPNHR